MRDGKIRRLLVLNEHGWTSKTDYVRLRFPLAREKDYLPGGRAATPGKVPALLLHLQLQVDRRGSLLSFFDRVGVLAGFV